MLKKYPRPKIPLSRCKRIFFLQEQQSRSGDVNNWRMFFLSFFVVVVVRVTQSQAGILKWVIFQQRALFKFTELCDIIWSGRGKLWLFEVSVGKIFKISRRQAEQSKDPFKSEEECVSQRSKEGRRHLKTKNYHDMHTEKRPYFVIVHLYIKFHFSSFPANGKENGWKFFRFVVIRRFGFRRDDFNRLVLAHSAGDYLPLYLS